MGNRSATERRTILNTDVTKRGVNKNGPTEIIVISSAGQYRKVTVNPSDTMRDIDKTFTTKFGKQQKLAKRVQYANIVVMDPELNYFNTGRRCWLPLDWDASVSEVDRLVLAYTTPDVPIGLDHLYS